MARQKINAGSQLSVPVTATPTNSAAAALTSGGNLQGRLPIGSVVQVIYADVSSFSNASAQIPYDDTIPQNTEGREVLTGTITPSNSSNKLLIEALIFATENSNTSDMLTIALFQDSTADALSAATYAVGTNEQSASQGVLLRHYMTAGTTSATTFKIRVGLNTNNDIIVNGSAGARKMGGVLRSSITITEISA